VTQTPSDNVPRPVAGLRCLVWWEAGRRAVTAWSRAHVRGLSVVSLSLAVVAACFSAVVATTLLVAYVADRGNPYTEMTAMPGLQAQLDSRPTDDAIKQEVRQYDVQLRRSFFRRRELAGAGRWLLAGGLIVAVAAARFHAWLHHRLDHPPLDAGSEEPDWTVVARRNAGAVAAMAVVAGVMLLGSALLGHAPLPDVISKPEEVAAPILSGPETAWPAFRGPEMIGVVPPGEWPDDWDAATGRNILWKCPVPGQGNSSPVVWGNRIFLTSASQKERWVHCIGAAEGRILWTRKVASPPESAEIDADLEAFEMTGYAAPTAVTDGEHVWATFANADVVCFDAEGSQVWIVNLGKPDNQYGMASSLLLYKDLLILQHDMGVEAEDGLSTLIAMNTATGDIVWETERPVPNSWTTPILIGPDEGLERTELVTCANPYVMAYDPATGKELWRVKGLSGDVAPSPVFAGGLVFAVNTESQAMAVRPGGSGDVTDTHVVWTYEEDLPELVSPVASGAHYLQVDTYGTVTCLRASDGAVLWQHDFECQFQPSPSLVGSLVYLPNEAGKTFIFPLADEFTLRGTCSIGERQSASPAFSAGRIYIRGAKNLYCIGKVGGS